MAKVRKAYPSDLSDAEGEFCAPYLTLMKEQSPQRKYALGELFNGLRWFVRAGGPWRRMPHDLPPVDGATTADTTLAACRLL
jgi:transposase